MQTDKSLEFDLGKLKQEKQSIGQANSFHVEKVLQEKEQELHQLNLEKGGSLADRIKKRDELNANIKIAQDTLAKVKTSIKQAPIVFRGFIWLSTYSTTNKLNRQVSSAQKELKLLNNTIAEQNESLIAKEQQLQKTIKYLQEKVSITQITATGVNVDVAFANKQIKEKKKNQEVVSAKIEHLQSVIEHMQDNIEAVQAMTISSPMTPEILVSKKKFSRAVGEGSNLLNQFDEVVNSSDNSSGFNANVQEKEDTPELNNTSGFNQQSVNSSGFCPSCSCC
jgi:vacuolar-type H+-ATPase subunit I/STV1